MKTLSTAGNPGPAGATLRHSPYIESAAPAPDRPAPAAVPFITDHEGDFHIGHSLVKDMEPALLINPNASAATLIRAIESRASLVRDALQVWRLTAPDGGAEPSDVASVISPTAQEVLILIEALSARIVSAERRAAGAEGGAA